MAFVPNSQLFPSAFAQYDQFLTDNKVVKGTKDAEMITRVGQRIAVAAERWLNANGYQGYLKDYKWEYNLVNDKTVNAWCMPGGKVVFYTGILPICQDADGIAVVMGHEVAHAIARHGNERMSQGLLLQGGGMALDFATANQPDETRALFGQAYGMGATVGAILPFSRLHESEADEMGLIFTAMAGYDPAKAVPFWERMSRLGGQRPPEFLSTHPDPEKRSAKLAEQVRMARAYAIKYGTP